MPYKRVTQGSLLLFYDLDATQNAKHCRVGEGIKILYRLRGHVNSVKSLNIDDPRCPFFSREAPMFSPRYRRIAINGARPIGFRFIWLNNASLISEVHKRESARWIRLEHRYAVYTLSMYACVSTRRERAFALARSSDLSSANWHPLYNFTLYHSSSYYGLNKDANWHDTHSYPHYSRNWIFSPFLKRTQSRISFS